MYVSFVVLKNTRSQWCKQGKWIQKCKAVGSHISLNFITYVLSFPIGWRCFVLHPSFKHNKTKYKSRLFLYGGVYSGPVPENKNKMMNDQRR